MKFVQFLGEGGLRLGEVIHLSEGGLRLSELEGSPISEVHRHLSEPRDSCRHCFPTVLNIVQVGSCGGTPYAKGTLSSFTRLWVLVNGTQRCGIGLHDIHMISTG